jgi:hypothetical protein
VLEPEEVPAHVIFLAELWLAPATVPQPRPMGPV